MLLLMTKLTLKREILLIIKFGKPRTPNLVLSFSELLPPDGEDKLEYKKSGNSLEIDFRSDIVEGLLRVTFKFPAFVKVGSIYSYNPIPVDGTLKNSKGFHKPFTVYEHFDTDIIKGYTKTLNAGGMQMNYRHFRLWFSSSELLFEVLAKECEFEHLP